VQVQVASAEAHCFALAGAAKSPNRADEIN
jgi:hypothetical protein